MPELSDDAKKLLKSATELSGWINLVRASGPSGPYFYVRTQKPPVPAFAEGNVENSGAYCHWQSVLDELLTNGLIRLSSKKSSITNYKLTELGVQIAH